MSQEIFDQFGNNPTALCKQWLEDATQSEPNDPEAVNLATCNKDGSPSNRMVLVKEISDKGFKFHTNAESQKGTQIADNPKGSMCFYWKSTRKQIRIEGRIKEASAEEADAYFATRSIERQTGAWASKQSQPFEKWEDLENAVKKYEEEFAGIDNIPRPPYWKGYRLVPDSIEFWIAHKDRLHTRFIYKKDGEDWTATWLCP
jgi:pyridoxamine 5'-phosphate oxidase